MEQNNKPMKKFKAGGITAAVWESKIQLQNGRSAPVQSVTVDRSYKDKDGQFKNTSNLKLNDLPKAIMVLTQAYQHLLTKEGEEEASASFSSNREVV